MFCLAVCFGGPLLFALLLRASLRCNTHTHSTPAPHPYAFVPFAIDTYGRLGPAAMAYLGRLAERVADRAPVGRERARAAFMETVLRDLSASRARSIGVTYHASLKLRARVAGSDFRPGLAAPSTVPVQD